MAFRFEEDLRSSFRANATPTDWWPRTTRDWNASLYESTCSEGRADLVWASFGDDRNHSLQPQVPSLLQKPVYSRILALLKPVAERTFEFLCARTGATARTVRSSLQDLQQSSIVVERTPDRFVLGNDFAVPQVCICSFEFKLKSWRRALYQATRYRSFSHRVFVVMPPETIRPAQRNLAKFRTLNVGLIKHDEDGTSTIEYLPQRERPRSRHHYIRAVGMLLTDSLLSDPSP